MAGAARDNADAAGAVAFASPEHRWGWLRPGSHSFQTQPTQPLTTSPCPSVLVGILPSLSVADTSKLG